MSVPVRAVVDEWLPVPKPAGFDSVFTRYRLRMTFIGNLCGGVPDRKELIQPWLESKKPKVRPPGGKSIDEIQEEVLATLAAGEEPVEFISNVFQRVDGRLVVRADNVRAHMKDCARVLSSHYVGHVAGEAAFSTRIINNVYPDKDVYWLPILRPDGTEITEPDGTMEKAVHIKGPTGTRSALKRFEYVNPPSVLEVDLCVIAKPTARRGRHKKEGPDGETKDVLKPAVSVEDLYKLFDYGGTHGFGPERGAGEGRYGFELFQKGS